jgi:hypothetical protein
VKWGRRIARQAVGWACLVLGVIFGPVPIIQGWPFILLGLSLLAPDFPWAKRIMDRIKERLRRKGEKVD